MKVPTGEEPKSNKRPPLMAPQGGLEAEAEAEEDEEEEGEGEHRERNGDDEEEEEEAATKKTMVVGIKMDSQSREILTWALVKLASPGDRVVAIHILPSSSSSSSSSPVDLDAMIAVYEGFCNLKQVQNPNPNPNPPTRSSPSP